MRSEKPIDEATETDLYSYSWSEPARFSIQAEFCPPGAYAIEIGIGKPAYVTAVFGFADPIAAPLLVSLERSAFGFYRKIISLSRNARLIEVLVEPHSNPIKILSVNVQRLSWVRMAAIGWRSGARQIGTPFALVKKLRSVLAGGGDMMFSDGPVPRRDSDWNYRDWLLAFESADQARALHNRIEALVGPRLLRILCVTSLQNPERLDIQASFESLRASVPDLAQVRNLAIDLAPPTGIGRPSQEFTGNAAYIPRSDAYRSVAQELRRAAADLVIFLDRPGRWSASGVLLLLHEFLSHPKSIAIYGDSDSVTPEGRRQKPFFKPDWSPEYIRSWNYVGPGVAFRGDPDFFDSLPPMQASLPTSYEVLLRLTTDLRTPAIIRHIPRILFHCTPSRGLLSDLDRQVATAVLPALEPGCIVEPQNQGTKSSLWRVNYRPARADQLISAIIPSKNNPQLLTKAVRSVLDAAYAPTEVIIVDNGSTLPSQHRTLDMLSRDPRVRTILDPRPFNFSQLINGGAKAAHGDLLLLLNDDVEATEPQWLADLASLALRTGVGCVGALLLYPNQTVQHAGVVLGIFGTAGHAFRNWDFDAIEIGHRLQVNHEVSALTGACLAVTAACFNEVGGFAEELPVTLNDVDFCLRVRRAGYRNILAPNARLIHRESTTRGLDTTPVNLQRLTRERDTFFQLWGSQVLDDPFYSPHLTRSREDYRPREV